MNITVPASIREKPLQLIKLLPEITHLADQVNKMQLSPVVMDEAHQGTMLGISYEAHETELSPRRITAMKLKLFWQSTGRPDFHEIRGYRACYHLFNDGEGTCYRTSDKDSHGEQKRYDNLTTALTGALAELNDGLWLTMSGLRNHFDSIELTLKRLRNQF